MYLHYDRIARFSRKSDGKKRWTCNEKESVGGSIYVGCANWSADADGNSSF